jgi:hypothetical protein
MILEKSAQRMSQAAGRKSQPAIRVFSEMARNAVGTAADAPLAAKYKGMCDPMDYGEDNYEEGDETDERWTRPSFMPGVATDIHQVD